MFKKSGNTLHITRGDGGNLTLVWEGHTFIPGESVDVNIYRANAMDTDPIATWTTGTLDDSATEITIPVYGEDTQFDSPITEPVQYWWEAVCGENTFIGYDEQGPKILNLYPGGPDQATPQ